MKVGIVEIFDYIGEHILAVNININAAAINIQFHVPQNTVIVRYIHTLTMRSRFNK